MALSDLMGLSGHREGVAFPNGPKQQNWCFFYVGKYSLTYSVHGKKIHKIRRWGHFSVFKSIISYIL